MKSERTLSVPFIALLLCGFAAQVHAPEDDVPPTPANGAPRLGPPTTVHGVTVTASRETPKVVSTFPMTGQKVAPGLLVLRVTYDTRMRPDAWSYAEEARAAYPDCADAPRLLDDGKSFLIICRTLPSRRYAVWFNRPPLEDFASVSRRPAQAYELVFSTTDAEPVRTLADAMKADPVSAKANPVEAPGQRRPGQYVDPTADGG